MLKLEIFIPVSNDEELALACVERLLKSAEMTNNICITIGLSDYSDKWKSAFKHIVNSHNGLCRLIEHEGRVWSYVNVAKLWESRKSSNCYMIIAPNLIPETFNPFNDALLLWNSLENYLKDNIGYLSLSVADSVRWYPDQIEYLSIKINNNIERFFSNTVDGLLEEKVIMFNENVINEGIFNWPLTKDAYKRGLTSWASNRKLFSEARFA